MQRLLRYGLQQPARLFRRHVPCGWHRSSVCVPLLPEEDGHCWHRGGERGGSGFVYCLLLLLLLPEPRRPHAATDGDYFAGLPDADAAEVSAPTAAICGVGNQLQCAAAGVAGTTATAAVARPPPPMAGAQLSFGAIRVAIMLPLFSLVQLRPSLLALSWVYCMAERYNRGYPYL